MTGPIINRLNVALQRFQQIVIHFINAKLPPGAAYAIDLNSYQNEKFSSYKPKLNIKDIIGNGFLWAVPTHRRTIEKRRNRKFGFPQWVWKPMVPKTNILMCTKCGHDYLSDTLCSHCYGKAKEETLKMQEAIQNELGLDSVEKEVVVLYEGEKKTNFWKNQRIVEIPRKRPSWFHSNLLQQTTEEPVETTPLKPDSSKLS